LKTHDALHQPFSTAVESGFPIAENLAKEFLSLPMFPELTEEQIEYVAFCVGEAVGVEALA
jgi:dTDP-4-amino-4,6-dideoxygalactose transaminase